MGKPSREKGAQAERDAAKALGWQRGRAYSGEPDVYGCLWVGSVKCRARWPAYIEEAVEDARQKAVGTDKEPIVILMRRRKGAPPLALICHIGFQSWIDDHGEGKVDDVRRAMEPG